MINEEKFEFIGINNNGNVFKSNERMVIVRNSKLSLDNIYIKNKTFENSYIEKLDVISQIPGEMIIYSKVYLHSLLRCQNYVSF